LNRKGHGAVQREDRESALVNISRQHSAEGRFIYSLHSPENNLAFPCF
jgi:hypothetical protein